MEAKLQRDIEGQFWQCGFCLADYSILANAQNCCADLVMKPADMTGLLSGNKPLTAKGIAYLARPASSSFEGRKT